MPKNQKWKEKIITLFVGICAIALGYILITSIDNLFGNKKEDKVDQIAQDIKSIQQNLSPYEYKEKLKKIAVLSDFENTSINGNPSVTSRKTLNISGKIKTGYLYAKVSINQKPINKWSDLYVKIQRNVNGESEEYGGHLITSKSLETPIQKEYSEILFNLNDVKYKEKYTQGDIEIISSDWLKLFNENIYNPKVISFTSTADKGKIIELSIYYECVDGEDCSIILSN
ncbi:MAG: hypothetical protein WC603_04010 [Candidatus Paceibacterota bacterium]|jgi:hypothetical protein